MPPFINLVCFDSGNIDSITLITTLSLPPLVQLPISVPRHYHFVWC